MRTIRPALTVVLILGGVAVAWGQSAREFERAYAGADWAAAAKAAERWAERQPDNSTAAYNAACAHALAGEAQAALDWLRRAGTRGFAGARSIDEDPDLALVRGHQGFGEATAVLRANRERMFLGWTSGRSPCPQRRATSKGPFSAPSMSSTTET